MNCPKCDNDLWKASIAYKHIVAGKGFVAVNLNCSKCGYNFKAYVVNKDLIAISKELQKIREAVDKFKLEPRLVEKKRRFGLFGRR